MSEIWHLLASQSIKTWQIIRLQRLILVTRGRIYKTSFWLNFCLICKTLLCFLRTLISSIRKLSILTRLYILLASKKIVLIPCKAWKKHVYHKMSKSSQKTWSQEIICKDLKFEMLFNYRLKFLTKIRWILNIVWQLMHCLYQKHCTDSNECLWTFDILI